MTVNLVAGKTYVIEMTKTDRSNLDAFILLFNPQGKFAAKDDGGGNLNARLIYVAQQTGASTIYATTLAPRMFGLSG